MPVLRGERIEASITGAVGLLIVAGSFSYSWVTDGRIGPGILPGMAGVSILLSAVAMAFKRRDDESPIIAIEHLASPASDPGKQTVETSDGDDVGDADKADGARQRPWLAYRIFIVLGIIVAAILCIPLVGFAIACTIMVFVITFLVERRSLVTSVLTAGVTGILLWGLFDRILQVPLPVGLLFGG
jgi:putative tricarboxylic transport membrane protein